MSQQDPNEPSALSPISRRAFFRRAGDTALKIGALGTAAASLGQSCVPGGNCGYCNGSGRDYDHCDGDYCDYINYADSGGYGDSGGGNCGYCNGCGRDYDHCDGDYCDYINYSDGCV